MDQKEELSYIVEDRVLAEVLGRQNFSNKESAILELVKNAYDAGADNLSIIFKNTKNGVVLTIIDDGAGMNENDIRYAWMHVGKSTRGYVNNENQRVYAGSKGIGRFALSRLGEEIEMYSKKEHELGVLWSTNWEKSFLNREQNIVPNGTTFIIKYLRDRWNRRSVKPLARYLSSIYNDTRMKITIEFENENEVVKKIWNEPVVGENYTTKLTISYNSNNYILKCQIESDEFNDRAAEMTNLITTKAHEVELDMYHQLSGLIKNMIEDDKKEINDVDEDVKKVILDNEIKAILNELGSFSGNFYFSLKSTTKTDYEWFEYKYKTLSDRYQTGVILYRNAFGIDSFEGRNDWLGISNRVASSPAAASHPTGNWRVRFNQISGYLEIDKKRNKVIEDLSNRQGIAENIHFEVFKKIILVGISELEAFRQKIIREINSHKKKFTSGLADVNSNTEDAVKIVNNLRDDFSSINKLTELDIDKVIQEFDRRENENKNIEREKKEIEEKSRYESQLLNVLATSQLKINSLGHEIRNDRNSISATPTDLEEAIKEIINWEDLLDEDIPLYKNIPRLLNNLTDNTKKILNLTDTILEEMEKEKFTKNEYDLENLIEEIIKKWANQYSWVNFKNIVDSQEKVLISYDQLMVIFDNLILNSIQQNEDKRSSLEITIKIFSDEKMIYIDYEDDGIGLDEKYLTNPMKILEVHESTRKKGHGLGMWMVNNTINKLDGKIEEIKGENSFHLSAFIKV